MNSSDTVIETQKGSIKIVRMNKPKKKNALDIDMYLRITEILNAAATDDKISAVVITGTGDFYSSGNDLGQLRAGEKDFIKLMVVIRYFVRSLILFPKILIAILNGPAVGIATTTLPFCDLVFASENAYFYTPFVKLGVVPEACSSVTFPRIMGERRALEMLLFGKKMDAKEALECGYINYIYKTEEIESNVWDKINKITEAPPGLMAAAKRLMKIDMQELLLKTNDRELEEIVRIKTSYASFTFDSFQSRL